MLANLAASLILSDRIETTLPRAKELRRIADRMVTLSKRKTIHARRQALAVIRNRDAVNKAFAELADRFADRHGGYTRIYKLGFRHGDSAPMAVIEYISKERSEEKAEKQPSAKKPKAKVKAKGKAEAAPEKPAEETGTKKKAAAKKAAPKAPKKKETKRSEAKPKKSKKS
jgi:large subunit ribosomal protein L17